MPNRIQRQRTKGWRMPAGAIYVGRPSVWGNPWTVRECGTAAEAVRRFRDDLMPCLYSDNALGDRLGLPYPYPPIEDVIRERLVGHDLVCWCPLDQPCHADVLLALANGGGPPVTATAYSTQPHHSHRRDGMEGAVMHTCTKHEPSEACYCHCHCRCTDCCADRTSRQKRRRHFGSSYIPAERARRHMWTALHGMSYTDMSMASLVARATLRRVDEGHINRVTRATERAILSIEPQELHHGQVLAVGTWRRLQALQSIGWTLAAISAHAGMSASWASMLGREWVQASTREKVRAAYDDLWDKRPPIATIGDRIRLERTLARAKTHGWPPPMAWDDDEMDDPTATPHPWRRTESSTTRADTIAEAAELGCSLGELCERFGVRPGSVERALWRSGRPDLWARIRPAGVQERSNQYAKGSAA